MLKMTAPIYLQFNKQWSMSLSLQHFQEVMQQNFLRHLITCRRIILTQENYSLLNQQEAKEILIFFIL